MLPIHWRLAEITMINKTRKLTDEEEEEFGWILQANLNFANKLNQYYNCAAIASMTDDTEWLRECVNQINRLEYEYKIKKPDARKQTDL